MSRVIIGATVGSPLPKPNLMQDDPTKGDYVKGRAEFLAQVNAGTGGSGIYTLSDGETFDDVPDDVDMVIDPNIEADDISELVQAVIAELPDSGINVTGAEVGQTIVVKAVDENGKPTEWEPADIVKKTKLITILDITAEKDIVLSGGDTDDLSFGDAVFNHRHFLYTTPDGSRYKAKRIFGYIYVPSAVKGTSVSIGPYYGDGIPNSWIYGDDGYGSLCTNTLEISANSYYMIEASADKSVYGYYKIDNIAWSAGISRWINYGLINTPVPHFSGIKFYSQGSLTLPAGSKLFFRAEVYDE